MRTGHPSVLASALPHLALAALTTAILGSGCPDPSDPGPACTRYMACFFPEGKQTPYAGDADYEGFVREETTIRRAYGEGGSCWLDEERAVLCEARCLDEIKADCARAEPVCAKSCDDAFALESGDGE